MYWRSQAVVTGERECDGAKRKGTRRAGPLLVEIASYLAPTVAAPLACSERMAALSVASQVNSGSVRPKWP